MGFNRKLKYHLVQILQISNQKALELMIDGKVKVNQQIVRANLEIDDEDDIWVEQNLIKKGAEYQYYKFHKPRGIESTLNPDIENNLLPFLPHQNVFPVGRLDKESEGLMLLTNNGHLYDRTLRAEHKMEKEYWATVDRILTEENLRSLSEGIKIMGKMTMPCKVEKLDLYSFKITLIQGLNRQIRRMCYKLGIEVTHLKRVRIGNVKLGDLGEGLYEKIEKW